MILSSLYISISFFQFYILKLRIMEGAFPLILFQLWDAGRTLFKSLWFFSNQQLCSILSCPRWLGQTIIPSDFQRPKVTTSASHTWGSICGFNYLKSSKKVIFLFIQFMIFHKWRQVFQQFTCSGKTWICCNSYLGPGTTVYRTFRPTRNS